MGEGRADGPRALLAARLEELWQAAGAPPLDAVARNAGGSGTQLRVKLTGKKISAWKTGANVARDFRELESVVRILIQKARPIAPEILFPGLLDEKQWAKWWKEARQSSPSSLPSKQTTELGQVINGELNPYYYEVHRAITDENEENTLTLPTYIERQHDHHLRDIVTNAREKSTLVVLVGGSSTGKTRSCWEAVQALRGWRLWHPVNPSRPEALANAIEGSTISPHTVLWLNELQYYLDTPDSGLSERIAAGIRELLRDDKFGPILIIGTLWPERWDSLTRWPRLGEQDSHPQVRELLNDRRIRVPDRFEAIDLMALSTVGQFDSRIRKAIGRPDKRVAQFLAGAFELLSKYEAAPVDARALIDAAIDMRRFGFEQLIPERLLREAAIDYIGDYEWSQLSDDWFEKALDYTLQPCLGVSGPLARARVRSNLLSQKEPLYQLADFIEETGRKFRRYIMPPKSLWETLIGECSPDGLLDLAYEVQYRGRYKYAAHIYMTAAAQGEINGLLFLADHRKSAGDKATAEKIYNVAASRGSLMAYSNLADFREEEGDVKAARKIIEESLQTKIKDLENRTFVWEQLVHLCKETGEIGTAKRRLEQAAKNGDESAAKVLIAMDIEGNIAEEDSPTLIELRRAAEAVRVSESSLKAANEDIVNRSLVDAESYASAVQLCMEEAANEEKNRRGTNWMILLGKLYGVHGDAELAKLTLMKAINHLDDPYYEGIVPALAELVSVLRRAGENDLADQLWKYGLELDGSITEPWKVPDEI